MSTRIFDTDPLTRSDILWHADHDGSVTVEHRQDVTELVDANKREFNQWDERSRWGEGRKVAEIPMVTYMELVRAGIARDPAALKKWLNDPDQRVFRTSPGRL